MAPASNFYEKHQRSYSSESSSSSSASDRSSRSYNTAPSSNDPASKPSLRRGETEPASTHPNLARNCSFDPRASTDTYASTIPSDDEEEYEPEIEDDDSGYVDNGVLAATPVEFAELFPSNRRLIISHDDTLDGNMNLRVDTLVKMPRGGLRPFSLFHLRMRDLKSRDFSLRRYCRDSGREVASSIRKYEKPTEQRPALQRSVSARANVFTKSEAKDVSLKRADSGYESIRGEVMDTTNAKPTKSITLEFANYAHVDLTRRSNNGVKRYGFEYWGTSYNWKKVVKRTGELEEIDYVLFKAGSKTPVATIIPDILDHEEQKQEEAKHGWVPPCSMRIIDSEVISGHCDIADVIVATGLLTLVDDNIKRLSNRTTTVELVLPVTKTPLKMNMESITPRKLLGEVFGRRNSSFKETRPMTPIKV